MLKKLRTESAPTRFINKNCERILKKTNKAWSRKQTLIQPDLRLFKIIFVFSMIVEMSLSDVC